ncbi:hypothetical protein IB286_14235 [Spongiibacter sp. KMU-158]|uniref:Uncharacterized protein n=1 Tax=Spongiibacter pelagi TaxID=2760804 RepID=A0A927C593_9GAMM|nr:hypothetical protein [Spongiibacter pelagi]MBD2860157.1 hypothetical protein [Spongiibacter pelagi]
MKTPKAGVMAKDKIRERVLRIARGELTPKLGEPKIWLTDKSAKPPENLFESLPKSCGSLFNSDEFSVSEDFSRGNQIETKDRESFD